MNEAIYLAFVFLAVLKLTEIGIWLYHRFQLWRLDRQRCEICNHRGARRLEIDGKPIRLCEAHFKEELRFHLDEILRMAREIQDRGMEGEEWKQ